MNDTESASITQCELKQAMSYDRCSGFFNWRISKGGRKIGQLAGYLKKDGYVYIKIKGRKFLAHRLAWLYENGEFPNGQIDHIDHVRNNNSIDNLRVVDASGNAKNRSIFKSNKSGVLGVSFAKDRNKWVAQIMSEGKAINLGRYLNIEDAIAARRAAEKRFGFHSNHGMARHSESNK